MSICTFFGHRDCNDSIKPVLVRVLKELIEKGLADTFYVGNNGMYDSAVISVLKDLSQKYTHIKFYIILAYLPLSNRLETYDSETIFPEGIENVPPRFAIVYRNKWMLQKSDYVACHIVRPQGGAAIFYEMAQKMGKQIINLADIT